jgi:hypothetical protein
VVFFVILLTAAFVDLPFTTTSSSSVSLFVNAYRVGDTIHAAVNTRSSVVVDLMIANLPLFGISRKTELPRLQERFSLSFEEGLHTLSYIDGQTAETIRVTFIYSKSGEGRIHSVSSTVVRTKSRNFDPKLPIVVQYEWIEEEPVDLNAGSSIMFLATLLLSILFLIQLCGSGEGDEDGHIYDHHHNHTSTMFDTGMRPSSSKGYPSDARWKQRD